MQVNTINREITLSEFLNIKSRDECSVVGEEYRFELESSGTNSSLQFTASLGDELEQYQLPKQTQITMLKAEGIPKYGIGNLLSAFYRDPMWRYSMRYGIQGGIHDPGEAEPTLIELYTESTPYFLWRLSRVASKIPAQNFIIVQADSSAMSRFFGQFLSVQERLKSIENHIRYVWKSEYPFSTFDMFLRVPLDSDSP